MADADSIETPAEQEHVLIARVRDRDEDAFEILYERYLPRVYQFVS